MPRGASRVGLDYRPQLQGADRIPALAKRHDVAVHGLELGEFYAGKREQLMAHALEMLGDDMKSRMGKEVMDIGDAAGHRILDRDQGELGLAGFYRSDGILEGGAGKRLHARISILRGEMRIGPRLALKGDSV